MSHFQIETLYRAGLRARSANSRVVTEEPAVPETNDGNQRWAFIDLLLWTAFLVTTNKNFE